MSAATETVHVLMGRILAELPAIAKGDRAPANMGGYSFRGIEDVTAALKPLLGRHGVFVVPTTLERRDSERQTRGGGTMYVVDVHVLFDFYGPAGDSVSASAWGQGTDSGDKSPQKGYTSALKTVLGQVFCIADSATDSERHEVPETSRHSPKDTATPPAPEDWYKANGWKDEAEQIEGRKALREMSQALTGESVPAWERWIAAQNLDISPSGLALTLEEFDRCSAMIAVLATGVDSETGEVATTPAVAPQEAAAPNTGDTAPEGQSDEPGAESADPGDPGPCAYCGSILSQRFTHEGRVRCIRGSACARRVADAAAGISEEPEPVAEQASLGAES